MSSQTLCPETVVLRDLLSGTLPEAVQADLAEHVGACDRCRQELDSLAGGAKWVGAARRGSGDQPGSDARLRELIEGLKAERPAAPAVAAGPALISHPSLAFLDPPDRPNFIGCLGTYPIAGLIGRGGMGTVLKGLDTALNRFVAIKVLNPQLASSGPARERFLREARSAAAVTHEHVVTIHAVDDSAALPFLVMEYIVGVSLEDRIHRSGMLKVEEVLRIGMQAASGLAAAHAQGLVHRDIKPGNILLENGVERVKITDFGLARAAHDAQVTQEGAVAGTPQYMSPEQARGETVDHRSDLFSLGCVMYAMCAGRSPFRAETALAAIRRVCQDTPRPVREVNPQVPEWLADIIHRLLAKDPGERFQTAAEVAQVLGGCLAHLQQPSRVPPPAAPRPTAQAPRTSGGLLKGIATAACACLAVVLLVMLGMRLLGDHGPSGPRGETSKAAEGDGPAPEGQERFAFVDIQPQTTCGLSDRTDSQDNDFSQLAPGMHVLDGVPWQIGPRYIHLAGKGCPQFPRAVSGIQVARWADRIHVLHALQWAGNSGLPRGTAVANYVVHYEDGTTQVIPVAYGVDAEEWWSKKPHSALAAPVAWFGSNKAAASRGFGVNLVHFSWTNPRPARKIARLDFLKPSDLPASPMCLAITCEATGSRALRAYEASRGRLPVRIAADLILTLRGDEEQAACIGAKETELMLRPGRYTVQVSQGDAVKRRGFLAIAQGVNAALQLDYEVAEWPALEAQPESAIELPPASGPAWSVAYSHSGDLVAMGEESGRARLVRTSKTAELSTVPLSGHTQRVRAVAFSPDDKLLATASEDGAVRFWETATGACVATLEAHGSGVFCMAFSSDGTMLATGAGNGEVKLWDAKTRQPLADLPGHRGIVAHLAFARDGKTLASAGWEDRAARLWDVGSRSARLVLDGHAASVHAVAFAPDGKTVGTAGREGIVRLWDVETGRLLRRFETAEEITAALSFSPDGKTLAAGAGQGVKRWDLGTGDLVNDFHAHWGLIRGLAFSPDGATLATAGSDGATRLWDLAKTQPGYAQKSPPAPKATLLHSPMRWVYNLAISPKGDAVAAAPGMAEVRVWRMPDWHMLACFKAAPDGGYMFGPSLSYSPDGERLIACVTKGDFGSTTSMPTTRMAFFGRGDYAPMASRACPSGSAGLAVSPDGRWIVTSHWESQRILCSDAADGKPKWSASSSPYGKVSAPVFSSGGKLVALGTALGYILILDAETGQAHGKPLRHGSVDLFALAFSPDEKTLVSGGKDGIIKLWNVADGVELDALERHKHGVWSVEFSPDGRLLASSGGANVSDKQPWRRQGEVKLWDVASRRPVSEFSSHAPCACCAKFLPDGKTLVTSGRDGKVRVWDVEELLKHGPQGDLQQKAP